MLFFFRHLTYRSGHTAERGYIDMTRLYVLLTRGNVVGEKNLKILGSLLRNVFSRFEKSFLFAVISLNEVRYFCVFMTVKLKLKKLLQRAK